MNHPWQDLIIKIKENGWTQKQFAILLWKKVSEVNELIKWKRNVTIQWDLLLSSILWSKERYRLNKQIDYDYTIAKSLFDETKLEKNKVQVASTVSKNIITKKNKDNEKIFRSF
jgi:plasmid maintenance system antidote protein VapI